MPAYKIRDIKPNPFRNVDRYPIQRGKIDALRESIRTTTYWDNIIARQSGKDVEIAYGHHRLIALEEELGPDKEIILIIKELSNEDMIQIMARENLAEWGTSVTVLHETVRAVVEAYGAGEIELPVPERGEPGHKRKFYYAPSFSRDVKPLTKFADRARTHSAPGLPMIKNNDKDNDKDNDKAFPYTIETLSRFLGWGTGNTKWDTRTREVLWALELIDGGIVKEELFNGATPIEATALVRATRKVMSASDTASNFHEKDAEEAESMLEDLSTAESFAKDSGDKSALSAISKEKKQAHLRIASSRDLSKKERRKGREQTIAVAEAVSEKLKDREGRAVDVADSVAWSFIGKRNKRVPTVEGFAAKMDKRCVGLFDPKLDRTFCQGLDEVLTHTDIIKPSILTNLANSIKSLSDRALAYEQKFRTAGKKRHDPKPIKP